MRDPKREAKRPCRAACAVKAAPPLRRALRCCVSALERVTAFDCTTALGCVCVLLRAFRRCSRCWRNSSRLAARWLAGSERSTRCSCRRSVRSARRCAAGESDLTCAAAALVCAVGATRLGTVACDSMLRGAAGDSVLRGETCCTACCCGVTCGAEAWRGVKCGAAARCGAATWGTAARCGAEKCGAAARCGAEKCGAAARCGAATCGAATRGAATCGAATCGAAAGCGAAAAGWFFLLACAPAATGSVKAVARSTAAIHPECFIMTILLDPMRLTIPLELGSNESMLFVRLRSNMNVRSCCLRIDSRHANA